MSGAHPGQRKYGPESAAEGTADTGGPCKK